MASYSTMNTVPAADVESETRTFRLKIFVQRHCEICLACSDSFLSPRDQLQFRAYMTASRARRGPTFEQEEEFVTRPGTHRKRFRQRIPEL